MEGKEKEFDLLGVFKPNLASMSKKEKKVGEEALREENDRAFRIFEKRMAEKSIFEEKFTAADMDKNLFTRKTVAGRELTIIMPSEESASAAMVAKEGVDKVGVRDRLARNNGKYQVIVIAVNRENNEIVVSHRQAIALLRELLDQKLKECLKLKKAGKLEDPLRLSAKIVRHEKERRRFIVDLNGYALLGFMPYNAAGQGDISTLRQGMIVDVEVFDYKTKREIGASSNMYACSRRFRGKDNPWLGIEEKYPKNTTVNFKCVQKKDKVFFAAIEGLDNVLVYCQIPKADTGIEIIEGEMYQGYISSVSEENRKLRGRVLRKL